MITYGSPSQQVGRGGCSQKAMNSSSDFFTHFSLSSLFALSVVHFDVFDQTSLKQRCMRGEVEELDTKPSRTEYSQIFSSQLRRSRTEHRISKRFGIL
jgi:hypothetical protein